MQAVKIKTKPLDWLGRIELASKHFRAGWYALLGRQTTLSFLWQNSSQQSSMGESKNIEITGNYGYCVFMDWAKQEPFFDGDIFYNKWLGEFNPDMPAEEASERLGWCELAHDAQENFKRGWVTAAKEYNKKNSKKNKNKT